MEPRGGGAKNGVFVSASKSSLAALTLGAIGVVYGDIGTSVLYAVKEVFGSGHVPFTTRQRLRHPVHLLLDADRHRLAQVRGAGAAGRQPRRRRPDRHAGAGLAGGEGQAEAAQGLLAVGIFGTSLFYGDGVITPAISVLSAVEGLEVVSPGLQAGTSFR
jgi:KUP system potassium uptake protein